jgi:hypothetical protein
MSGTSVAVYGDISLADQVILRRPARGLDLLAVYLAAGRVVAAVCIGQTAQTEELVERAVSDGAIPVANVADPGVALEDAFFAPPARLAA